MDLLAGLDDIAWERMNHAYGPATEVPDLLRGLVDPNPAVREVALDGMYGAVHHQGDVYRCTVEAIPFLLRVVASFDLEGRDAVVRLLASIGGDEADDDPDFDEDDEEDEPEGRNAGRHFAEARALVAAEYPLWTLLLGDNDPLVRAAAAGIVIVARDRRSESLQVLVDRFDQEPDDGVRVAIVETVAEIARRGTTMDGLSTWLSKQIAADPSLDVRLTALAKADSIGGSTVTVDAAVGLLGVLYQRGTPPAAPAGFETDTLVGAIRQRREADSEGRHTANADQLVRSVSAGFGDRVEDRIELLSTLLRSPDPECRLDALYPVVNLISGWRGDYSELVRLVGVQLNDAHPALRSRAASVLESIGILAASAADALFSALFDSPRSLNHTEARRNLTWLVIWPTDAPTPGPAIKALASAEDRRVLPMLEWMLQQDDGPPDVGYLIGRFGPSAPELLPALRHRLRNLPAGNEDRHIGGLCYALRQYGADVADVVSDLLDLPLSSAIAMALGDIGPAASPALPQLLGAAKAADHYLARTAATGAYRISGDPAAALALAGRLLAVGESISALGLLSDIGVAAAPLLDRVRGHLSADDRGAFLASRILWNVERDADAVMPHLIREWDSVLRRAPVAKLWAELGEAAAGARGYVEEELARVRRHNVRENVYGSNQVPEDLDLVATCRAILGR